MFVQVNTLEAIKEYFEEGLSSHYAKGEISTLFEITCEHFLGWNKLEQKMKKEMKRVQGDIDDNKREMQHKFKEGSLKQKGSMK